MFGKPDDVPGVPIGALVVKDELASGKLYCHCTWAAGDTEIKLMQGEESLWLTLKRGTVGGFALRAAYGPGPTLLAARNGDAEGPPTFRVITALGIYRVQVEVPDENRAFLRCTVRFTPDVDLLTPFWPRDLYPINDAGDPIQTRGKVHAAQRGLNGGLVFLSLSEPCCGSLLYFQNLTALNEYFLATDTKPDGVVGGQWPELGYQPPTSPDAKNPPTKPLKAGQEIVLSDVFLSYRAEVPEDPRHSARLFLDMLAEVYLCLEKPETQYHDWQRQAEETLRDLNEAPEATIRHYGNRYVHPYTATEYPDSMVQLTVLTPVREYAQWIGANGKAGLLAEELRVGVGRFYDKELQTLRRYLPNVGDDKDADEVDSWYLYHPLINLGRLAKEGDKGAKELFLNSLDYAIKVAKHFEYNWPVQFNVKTLEVITRERKEGDPGQTDAGGLYAYAMIQAWELTGEARYLEEAKKTIEATKDRDFNLVYQTNLTAWGANACIRLWRITGEEFYREQSYVFLAGFFHNCVLWEPEIGHASNYPMFLGATCLHNAPYLAVYECFECFCAFHEYLSQAQDDMADSVRLLLTEFLKYTLTRAWYYYPKEIPKEILSTEIRNGHIDRKLAFPLEDMYPDGQPAGQVGQEIYGSGTAFALTTRSYHHIRNAPFLFYCEYPVADIQDTELGQARVDIRGVDGMTCKARLIPTNRKQMPSVTVYLQELNGKPDQQIPHSLTQEGHCELEIPAGKRLSLRWQNS